MRPRTGVPIPAVRTRPRPCVGFAPYMTRAALLLFALIAAFAAGVFGASRSRRAWERATLPPRRTRPAAVEAALAAWEEHAEGPPAGLEGGGPESAADVAFLRAAASGDDRALLEMARTHDGREASARALWTLVERAPDEATRTARRKAFGARWPDAWTLANARTGP